MFTKKFFTENIKTLFYALIIAIFIRSFFIQPFYIPSSSMEPNLLVGDRLFVSKFTYGYSKHSFPFSPNFSNDRFFSQIPIQGDLVVFNSQLLHYAIQTSNDDRISIACDMSMKR